MNNPRHTRTAFLFTIQQAQHFLEVIKADPLEALYVLALTTGMRQRELRALHWEDLDSERRFVQVHRFLPLMPENHASWLVDASSRYQRGIPLMSMTIEALQRYQNQQH